MGIVNELSSRALDNMADAPAIEFEGVTFGWAELRQVANELETSLRESGCHPAAPIVFVPRNRPSAIAALLGLIAKNHTIRMVYVFQKPVGIARDIERLRPAAVVAAKEDFTDEVRSLMAGLGIAGVELWEMGARLVEGLAGSTAQTDRPDPPRIEILTSGTTGPPKQFALEYDMFAMNIGGAGSLTRSTPQTAPTFFARPIGNISGLYTILPTLLQGNQGYLVDRFKLDEWLTYVRRYRPENGNVPPSHVQALLDAKVSHEDLASLRSLTMGAAPLDPTVQKRFEDEYGIPILLSYGATEFVGPVTFMTAELHRDWGKAKLGSVGRAFGGAELRVISPDTGEPLAKGEEGLLEVMTPRVGPQWLRTADIAMIDDDEFVWIRGRADGAIMRGGFKILPEAIERGLMLHDSISGAGVTGIPDARLGQVPAAAIKLKPGARQPSIEELDQHLRQHVYATHIPATWRFVEQLPLTASEKVDRVALREVFQNSGT